ncbi:MAG: hypothetical protein ACREUN_14890, partial [Burkholderiales bacterium]
MRQGAAKRRQRGHLEAGLDRISSRYTFVIKKVLPLLWFGGIGFFIWQDLANDAPSEDMLVLLAVFAAMAVMGFFVMKKLVWHAADEVYDGGSFLLVRNRGEEQTVLLSDVINVS